MTAGELSLTRSHARVKVRVLVCDHRKMKNTFCGHRPENLTVPRPANRTRRSCTLGKVTACTVYAGGQPRRERRILEHQSLCIPGVSSRGGTQSIPCWLGFCCLWSLSSLSLTSCPRELHRCGITGNVVPTQCWATQKLLPHKQIFSALLRLQVSF